MSVLSPRPLQVGVAGLGIAGAATALLLAEQGHRVRVFEAEPDPRPVGAGIWLQEFGQLVLHRLGLLEALARRSQPVRRVTLVTGRQKAVVNLSYDVLPSRRPALGVHRGILFELLAEAIADHNGIEVATGCRITGVEPGPAGVRITAGNGSQRGGQWGPFDLLVGADGRNSAVRSALGLGSRVRPYRWGALWAVVDDPDRLAGDELFQALRGTSRYFGVLPTGERQASIFWSVGPDSAGRPRLDQWQAAAAAMSPRHADLVATVEVLIPARYCDVTTRSVFRHRDEPDGEQAAVLLGDAAHAMSPQLGIGATMALHDAWSLATCLSQTRDHGGTLREALVRHQAARRAHVRWYQWCTRLMTPVFQSNVDLLALPRDLLGPVVSRPKVVRRLLVGQVLGDRTSPWSTLPAP